MTRLRAGRLSLLVVMVAAVAAAGPVAAHERRAGGALQFVVGWAQEPAYTGFPNAVQVTITEVAGGAPVAGAGESLAVEVIKGDEKVVLPLVPESSAGGGAPGDYRAWLTPTRPGGYTFRLTGTLRGQAVDETFSSSPATFEEVQDPAAVQFPVKDPTPGQVATRLDRVVPRLEAAVQRADDRAGRARAVALAGLAVGAVGLAVGGAALAAARRRR